MSNNGLDSNLLEKEGYQNISHNHIFNKQNNGQDDQSVTNIQNFQNNNHSTSNIGDQTQNLTSEQQQAFIEYQLMSQNLDFEDDYDFGLNYHDVPEYDVREKLQSLNARLASEPLPPSSEHRNSKVAFKEELVSVLAPPDNYDDSEIEFEENESEQYYADGGPLVANRVIHQKESSSSINVFETKTLSETLENKKQLSLTQETKLNNDENKQNISLTNDEDKQNISQTNNENKQNISPTKNQSNRNDLSSDTMVLSRGGKFQYIGTNEIIDSSNPLSENEDKLLNRSKAKQMKVRPVSAQVSKRYNRAATSSTISDSSFQKHNGVPHVDKEALRRQKERRKKKEEEKLKRIEEEENMKKDINSKSFESWLQIKQKQRKEEIERKRKEEDEEFEKKERQQEERKYLAQELESELIKKNDQDKKKEEKLKQYRLKEIEETMIVHSDTDCDKAFKDWLKKKHREYKNKLKEEKQNARLARLTMRQSRKSHDLALAIQQSTSSRYLDLY